MRRGKDFIQLLRLLHATLKNKSCSYYQKMYFEWNNEYMKQDDIGKGLLDPLTMGVVYFTPKL
jgi:hypothetical protein